MYIVYVVKLDLDLDRQHNVLINAQSVENNDHDDE